MRRRKKYVFFMLMYLVTGYIVYNQKVKVDIYAMKQKMKMDGSS